MLEECNPIVLVLILMLVLVGRLPPKLMIVKIDFYYHELRRKPPDRH